MNHLLSGLARHRMLLTGWLKIAGGNAASGLLRLVALGIAAHSLGAIVVGVLVVIEAYARVVDGLINFQSVHVMTRFLAQAQQERDSARFRDLVKAGLAVDVATAVGAFAFAILLMPVAGPLLGVPADWIGLAMLFCVVILTRIIGTPEAVFRCFDRYWAIGLRESTAGALIVVASLAAWWMQAGAATFLLIWLVAQIAANMLFLTWSFAVLRREELGAVHRASAVAGIRSSPGFWRMLWETNLTFGVRTLSQEGDVLIAGAVLGSGPAGLLRAAKNLAGVVSQSGRPLHQVASAHITRLWIAGKVAELLAYTRKICIGAAAIGFALTVLFAMYGDVALRHLFGAEFVAAAATLTILMLANALYLAGVTLLPTMLATGDGTRFLYGILLGTAVYVAVIVVTVDAHGNVGIAMAHVAFNAVWVVYCWRVVWRRLAEARALATVVS